MRRIFLAAFAVIAILWGLALTAFIMASVADVVAGGQPLHNAYHPFSVETQVRDR